MELLKVTGEVKIHIINFKKWQRPTEGRREWFALDAGFFFDRKVREARRLCDDAPDCFIALWREADANGDVSISLPSLKSYWKEILGVESNFFKPVKRLEALSKAGLLTFHIVPTDSLPAVYPQSTDSLPTSYSPVEPLETPVAVSKNNTNKQTDIERCASDFSKTGEAYAMQSGNVNMHHFHWVKGYLTRQYQEIRKSRPEIPAEAILKVWQESCDKASAKAASAAKWYMTTFENSIADWSPSAVRSSRGGVPQAQKPKKWEPHLKAKLVRVRFEDGDVFEVAGNELKWSETGGYFLVKGRTARFDQMEIVEP
jgi:hypothetical protein